MLLAVLLFTFGIANMIASSLWVNPLVLAASVGGRSVLLSVNETNRTHNERRVMESRVLLQREGGTTAETSFLSTSGIFVPSLDVNAPLPRPGVGFRVRHLPNYPDAFLILTDDDSDYLHEMRCGDVGRRAVEARSRADFQRNDAVARAQSEKFAGEWEACKGARPRVESSERVSEALSSRIGCTRARTRSERPLQLIQIAFS